MDIETMKAQLELAANAIRELEAEKAMLALQATEYKSALVTLVKLKVQKETIELEEKNARDMMACPSLKTIRLRKIYEDEKPIAWIAARRVLNMPVNLLALDSYVAEQLAEVVEYTGKLLTVCDAPLSGDEPSGFAWSRRNIKARMAAIPLPKAMQENKDDVSHA